MTENSDSGFTEINQTRSSDTSQHGKSKTASPEPDIKENPPRSDSVDSKLDNSLASNSRSVSKSSGSSDSSSSDDDSDDDDYEGSKPSVLNWVSWWKKKSYRPILTHDRW